MHNVQFVPMSINIIHAVLFLTGLRSWNVDLTVCDLNKELQLFETRHTAQFSSQVKGQSECIELTHRIETCLAAATVFCSMYKLFV